MIPFKHHIQSFFSTVARGNVEIYNEFSLQHELGVYLRSIVDAQFKIQFERNVSFFNLASPDFIKKEIDIVCFSTNPDEKYAFELKFPRNGQHPEQIFKACQDIRFLEQLHQSGFNRCYFIEVVDDPLFYERGQKTGIYQYFRAGASIYGRIYKPTGARNGEFVEIQENYTINWNDINGDQKYTVVEIG